MVSITANPRLWRVEFGLDHSSTARSTIVCYLHVVTGGLRIYYSHHCVQHRSVDKGAWGGEGRAIRHDLTPGLKAVIESGLFYEIWKDSRIGEIRIAPWDADTRLEDINAVAIDIA